MIDPTIPVAIISGSAIVVAGLLRKSNKANCPATESVGMKECEALREGFRVELDFIREQLGEVKASMAGLHKKLDGFLSHGRK